MRISNLIFSACLLCGGILATVVRTAAAQATGGIPDASSDGEYIVRAGDVLHVRVWPDAALGGEYPVEESGVVYLPVLGEVRAAGMTLEALRRELRERYGQAIKTPVVAVTPRFRVSVLGAVQRPGLYLADPTQSVFDVISLAGGFRGDAKERAIRIIREGRVLEINAQRALETGEALLAMELRSGDRIVVPARGGRIVSFQNVFFLLQSAVLLATLIELTRR